MKKTQDEPRPWQLLKGTLYLLIMPLITKFYNHIRLFAYQKNPLFCLLGFRSSNTKLSLEDIDNTI